MTEEEIKQLCAELDEMAQRVGMRFVPDPEKIAALKLGGSLVYEERYHVRMKEAA